MRRPTREARQPLAMQTLSRRSDVPEVMNDADIPAADYAQCLRDLAAVNRVTFTHFPTLRWLRRATGRLPPGTPVAILDVACGAGDLLRAIHRWAARRRQPVALEGIDLNPRSAGDARAATPPGVDIAYRTGDVFAYAPDPKPDFVVTSQFVHHLSDAEVVQFLRWIDGHAGRGWFIADLQRHIVPYLVFPILARLMRWHPIIRTDGTISIARSFRRADWTRLLAQAGVTAQVRWSFPFRWSVWRLDEP